MGAAQTKPSLVQGTSLGAMTSEASPLSSQRTAHLEGPTTKLVGRAEPMLSNLIWPGHPSMASNFLFIMDLEPTTMRTDSQERWRLLHPYELEGVLNPSANTLDNLQWLARSKELVETIQTMEHLMDHPPMGARRDV